MKYYTGIGSRQTPDEILGCMRCLGALLSKNGYTLRSGAAGGADEAFEYGCREFGGNAQLFIPWANFCDRPATEGIRKYIPQNERYEEARQYLIDTEVIPWFDNMKQGAQKLHARNYYQVVGLPLEPKSEFLLAYCEVEKGKLKGGTRTAILLAESMGIPVFNFFLGEDIERFTKYIEENINV